MLSNFPTNFFKLLLILIKMIGLVVEAVKNQSDYWNNK